MTESKYKIIQLNQSVHTDQEDDDEDEEEYTENLDEDDAVTIVPSSDTDNLHFANKFNGNQNNMMQTPIAILTLILIYFSLSIGLTFYQSNLLTVSYWDLKKKLIYISRIHKMNLIFYFD